jgi:predicted nucleotide-binding protein
MPERFAEPPAALPYELAFVEEIEADRSKAPEPVRVGSRTEYGRVLLGEPKATDLLADLPDAGHRTLDHLEVRLAVSFVPARGRRFAWARLVVEMLAPQGVEPAPLWRDLFPRSVRAAVRCSRSFTVTPSLSFGFTEIVEGSVGGSGAAVLEYQPTVDGAGLDTDTAIWTFTGADRAGLRGSYELFLIADVPTGTPVSLRAIVDAEARGRYGPVPLRPASASNSPAFTHDLRRLVESGTPRNNRGGPAGMPAFSNTKYYHVRIAISDEIAEETGIDLTAEQLENLVLAPYRRGTPMMLGGRIIPIEQVRRVRIGESAEPAVNWLAAIRVELADRELSDVAGPSPEWRAAARATDITHRVLTGPPGSGERLGTTGATQADAELPNSVFLVAGRDNAIVAAVTAFLRSMKVVIIEWEQAVQRTGSPTPYVGDVVQIGMHLAQATLVLLTPDDVVHLREDLLGESDGAEERTSRGQARPNVFYEAGFADSLGRDRTIIVEAGPVKPFSDVAGRYAVQLDGSPHSRSALAGRLRSAGLAPDQTGQDWLTAGDIEGAIKKARAALTPPTGQ